MGPNSNFYAAISLAADLVIVNLLIVMTSLPIVTAGAALRAGNAVVAAMLAEEGAYPARQFFMEFRRQWKTASLWNLIVIALSLLASYELVVINQVELGSGRALALRSCLVSGLLVIAGITLWFYYLSALHPASFTITIVDAVQSAIRWLPRTLLYLFLLALPVIVLMLAPTRWLVALFFYTVIGVALTIYVGQMILRGALEH